MSGLLKRLGRLLTVNPEWSNSLLSPKTFRNPSPASRFNYEAPARHTESDTVGYAYFKRDSRRNYAAEIAIQPQKHLTSGEQVPGSQQLPPRPGRPHQYSKSPHQPPHSGYFPVINCE